MTSLTKDDETQATPPTPAPEKQGWGTGYS